MKEKSSKLAHLPVMPETMKRRIERGLITPASIADSIVQRMTLKKRMILMRDLKPFIGKRLESIEYALGSDNDFSEHDEELVFIFENGKVKMYREGLRFVFAGEVER